MKDAGDESAEGIKDKGEKNPKAEITPKQESRNTNLQSKASSAEEDLDVFLLGGDSDDGEGLYSVLIIHSTFGLYFLSFSICMVAFFVVLLAIFHILTVNCYKMEDFFRLGRIK